MSPIKAVCFDVGGVLANVALTWDAAVAASGVKARSPASLELEGFPAFREYQAARLEFGAYLDQLAAFLELDAAGALRVHESILLCPTKGTLEIIEALNAAGLVTGCLSNTNAHHWRVLNDPARFRNVAALRIKIASHEIGHNKPSAESYRAFEAASGARPEEILFFEDGVSNVEGAQRCGWQVALVNPAEPQADQLRARLAAFGR